MASRFAGQTCFQPNVRLMHSGFECHGLAANTVMAHCFSGPGNIASESYLICILCERF